MHVLKVKIKIKNPSNDGIEDHSELIAKFGKNQMENQTRISHFIFFLLFFYMGIGKCENTTGFLHVGVVLDLERWLGKTSMSSISMALQDFYQAHNNYTTRLVLHVRDSKQDVVVAAEAALDLLKNEQVKAIIGPSTSDQARFMVNLGDEAHVPIISFSVTSLSISSTQNPFFIRTAYNDSIQSRAIAAMIQAFGWLEVILIYEDTNYGNGILPCLTQAFQEINTYIPHMTAISRSATDEQILIELKRLMKTSSRVFVVHASNPLGSRILLKAKEVGMMSKGYAWIITDGLGNYLDVLDSSIIESMQGVLGVIPYVPKSEALDDFKMRWKRQFRSTNPTIENVEINVHDLWAYDTVWALAMAAERVGSSALNSSNHTVTGSSQIGTELRDAILATDIKSGLSGEFHLVDGQLQSSAFQIINVVGKGARHIGMWTPSRGISQRLDDAHANNTYSTSKDDLKLVVWPGEVTSIPVGSFLSIRETLRIGVPAHFTREEDRYVNGFCRDVFRYAVKALPFRIRYEFIPIEDHTWGGRKTRNANIDELMYQFHLQKNGKQRYDALVGDFRITYNRSEYVDFTIPYSVSGVSMLAPFKDDQRKDPWIFLKPLSVDLWITSGAAFIFIGFVVWVLEHQMNKDFRGPPSQQLGTTLWFSFSTLVFSHREKVINNLSRLVVIIWLFVVLVLQASYTASLTSLLTVQSLIPSTISAEQLIKNGDSVGVRPNSAVEIILKSLNFDESKIKDVDTDEWDKYLSKGSQNGGVSVIFAGIIHIKAFLRKHCDKYIIVGPTYQNGFGYALAFPRGSSLVSYFSKAIMKITDDGTILRLEKKWFGSEIVCADQEISTSLSLVSFRGLFLIIAVASASALLIHLLLFLVKHKQTLLTSEKPFSQRLASITRHFTENDLSSVVINRTAHDQGHVCI